MKQKAEELKQIRLSRVLELYSEGKTQRDIAQVLKVRPATVNRDLQKTRLDLYSAPEIMRRAVLVQKRLRDKIQRLESQQQQSLWTVIT